MTKKLKSKNGSSYKFNESMAMSKLCSPKKRLPHENALLVDASNKKNRSLFVAVRFVFVASLLEVCDWVVAWPLSPLKDGKGRNPSVQHLSNVDVQKASNVHRLLAFSTAWPKTGIGKGQIPHRDQHSPATNIRM